MKGNKLPNVTIDNCLGIACPASQAAEFHVVEEGSDGYAPKGLPEQSVAPLRTAVGGLQVGDFSIRVSPGSLYMTGAENNIILNGHPPN